MISEQVVALLASGRSAGRRAPGIPLTAARDARRSRIRRADVGAPIGLDGGELDAATSSRIVRATGVSIDPATRAAMESGFGADFSTVRIHADQRAGLLNRQLQARAFTVSNDIFFAAGEYDPHSRSGQRLLAHELTHVVQQGHAPADRSRRWDAHPSIDGGRRGRHLAGPVGRRASPTTRTTTSG